MKDYVIVPSMIEIDLDTHEATGAALRFCSIECLNEGKAIAVPDPGFTFKALPMSVLDVQPDEICSNCMVGLNNVFATDGGLEV